MSKILITGGTGFIGSHLVDRLLDLNHNVVIVDDLSTGQNINKNAKLVVLDINDPKLKDVFDEGKFDCVFHLAAQINLRKSFEDPILDAKINILGSLNVILNSVRTGVKKFIFASTGGAIYKPEAPLSWTEETCTEPASPYGLGKLTVENYLRIFKSLNWTVLRYSNVYGSRQNPKSEAGVVAIFTENALNSQPLKIFGDGEQTRDFIYVGDVVAANVHIMEKDLTGIFNVSTGTSVSVNTIAEMITSYFPSDIQYLPAISGEVQHTKLSSEKLQKTGWKPYCELKDAILRWSTIIPELGDI